MSELEIGRDERLRLRAESHSLKPVVLLGQNGLTEAVFKEIGKALDSHGLIKIRLPMEDREERMAAIEEIVDKMGAAKVQVIGKTLTVWRPMPEKEEPAPAKKAKETKKPRSRGGKVLKTDKKKTARAKAPVRRARPARARTVKKAMGA